jgi:ATP-dependent protease ClpP protease subunit
MITKFIAIQALHHHHRPAAQVLAAAAVLAARLHLQAAPAMIHPAHHPMIPQAHQMIQAQAAQVVNKTRRKTATTCNPDSRDVNKNKMIKRSNVKLEKLRR